MLTFVPECAFSTYSYTPDEYRSPVRDGFPLRWSPKLKRFESDSKGRVFGQTNHRVTPADIRALEASVARHAPIRRWPGFLGCTLGWACIFALWVSADFLLSSLVTHQAIRRALELALLLVFGVCFLVGMFMMFFSEIVHQERETERNNKIE